MKQIFSLGMTVSAFTLLLLVQFPSILASKSSIHLKVCGTDLLAYSSFHDDDDMFYINGNRVDQNSFCKALRFHHAKGCFFDNYHGDRYCGLDPSVAELALKHGRKLLQKDVSQVTLPKEKKNNPTSFPPSKQVGIAATGIVAISCLILCPCLYRKRKATSHTVLGKDPVSMDSASSFDDNSDTVKVPPSPHRVPPSPKFSMSPKVSVGSVHLNLNQVAKATQNFSRSLQIGEGGFGTVYKAQLEDKQVVAIKRAKKEQYENLRSEFSSEVELLSKIDHRNLVKLIGYVDQGDERLIITEYVPNGTVREHLDGQRGKILDFNQRLEIVIDIAHGLTYLHTYAEKQIIHRDIKSSNILLTENMRAKVSDFGFARLGPMDSDQTHISTKVKGTVGYLDPEYMKTYQLTSKSDVYSFGILLLEILTGRRPVDLKRPADERVTLRWAFRMYNEGNVMDVMDPLMEERVNGDVLEKMFALAFQCAAPVRSDRPDMKTVGKQLWAIRADYAKSITRE